MFMCIFTIYLYDEEKRCLQYCVCIYVLERCGQSRIMCSISESNLMSTELCYKLLHTHHNFKKVNNDNFKPNYAK